MPLRTLRTLSLLAIASLALAQAAPAQWGQIRTRDVIPPSFGNLNSGTPGPTQLMGSEGSDTLMDPYKNDVDVFHDGPGGSDGAPDSIDADDGDGLDTVYAGPEDSIQADAGDTVIILPPGGGDPLWSGTFAQYKRLKALVRWVRDQLQALFATSPSNEEPDFWLNAGLYVSAQLSNEAPSFAPGETISFQSAFDLGPYEEGDVPESPLDCLNWMNYYDDDPLTETALIDFDAAEYEHAEAGAQALLGYLIEHLADE